MSKEISNIHNKKYLILNNNIGIGFGWGIYRNISYSYSPNLEKFITNRISIGVSMFYNYSITTVNDTNIKLQGIAKDLSASLSYSYYFFVRKNISFKASIGFNYGFNRVEIKEERKLTYHTHIWGHNYSGGIGIYYRPRFFRNEKFNKFHLTLELNKPLDTYRFLYKINFFKTEITHIHTIGFGISYRF